MVDLPTVPQNIVTSEAPKTALSRGQIASPYQLLGEALDKVGQGYQKFGQGLESASKSTEDLSVSMAKQAGLRAVTRDADGNIQVEQAPIVGPAAVAYQRAVKFAALAEGEGEARRKDIELRTEFRDNPEGYLAAADAFKKNLQKQYTDAAGPEVGLAMAKAIDQVTTQTYKGLLNEKERLDLHRAVNTIDAEIETTKNQMYAMARGGVTSGPDWDAASGKVRSLYQSLGENPRLAYPQEKIKLELSQFDSELKVQGLSHHVVDGVYAKEGYEAAAKIAESIRTDPKLNLSPAQRDTAYSRVMAQLNARARDDMRVLKGTAQQIDGVEKMALNGYAVPPEQMGKLRAEVSAAKVPELTQALDQTEAIVATMKQWSTFSPTQLEASLGSLEKTMREKGATPTGLALKDAGEKLLKNMRKEVAADPLGWSNRTNVMPVPPIQFGSPDAGGQMADRANRAEIVAQHYGIAPTYLRPDEKAALEVAASKGGDAMLAVARTLVDGFGDRAPKVMAEISNDAPALAHVGALMQSGGNTAFAVDVADAVKLRQDKEFKIPKWLDHPADKIMAAQGARAREVYGAAFALAPDSGRAAQKAAQDAFFTRANRNGYEPLLDTADSKKAYDRALQDSAGAKFIDGKQYGGIGDYKPGYWTNYRVMVPGNVRADRFRDAIGAITDEDLSKMAISPVAASGKAYTAADIRAAVPIATRGGYRFAMGDPNSEDPKYIRGADGKPFVLDFGQMEERLRARVPGAFLGGAGDDGSRLPPGANPTAGNAPSALMQAAFPRPSAAAAAHTLPHTQVHADGLLQGKPDGSRIKLGGDTFEKKNGKAVLIEE